MLARVAFTLPRLIGTGGFTLLLHQSLQLRPRTAFCDSRPSIVPPRTPEATPSVRLRVFAHAIDAGYCLLPVGICIGALAFYVWRGVLTMSAALVVPCTLALLAVPLIYDLIFLQRHAGTTPGKRLLGLRVVQANGDAQTPLSWLQIAVRRACTSYLAVWNFLLLCIDKEHRSLADRLAQTRVVFAKHAD
jgi:uncharacterized RDD family membrane protein YckC